VTGSIGAIYNLSDRINLRLNLSRGFRAPNLSELGSNGEHEGTFRYEIGNSDLSPEFSWQGDLGIDYSSEIFSAQLSFFANHISDFIFLERIVDDQYQFTQGDARLWGGEVMVDFHPVEPLHFENTFSYVNARQLHQSEDARWLPFTPAPRWNSNLRYEFIRDGQHWLNNTYVSVGLECYLKQDKVHTANDTETATPSYTLFNMSAGTDVRLNGRRLCSIYLTATNLFNRLYCSHLSRLKYAEGGPVYNMGRNIGVKVVVPIAL
jgi:iron complex outermembrane receptor protein